jgi:hypothetical protein
MEVQITGCKDCPLFDNTGAEYGTYCHHPNRKTEEHTSSIGTSWFADAPIIDGADNEPITPEWCPLIWEPITIKY